MQTTTAQQGTTFTLRAECEADQAFIDALHHQYHVAIQGFERAPAPDGVGQTHCSVTLTTQRSAESLRDQAMRECISGLGKLLSLLQGDAAGNGHVCAHAANPQPQEQLSPRLKKLQLVAQPLGDVVGKQGAVLDEMQCAHGESSGETAIVAQEGGAA